MKYPGNRSVGKYLVLGKPIQETETTSGVTTVEKVCTPEMVVPSLGHHRATDSEKTLIGIPPCPQGGKIDYLTVKLIELKSFPAESSISTFQLPFISG